MRVSLQWLLEYVDLPTTDPGELERAFNMLGHMVERYDVETVEWTDVVVGKVASVDAHPNADAVRVTQVDVGDGELHQIICGAWNFEAGAVVPVAMPGAVLPGDFKIGQREIRGVVSNGMICSESELGLGTDHDGILVMRGDETLGDPFESLLELPDVVFELDVTSNRPDALSIVGIARELAAWFDLDLKMPSVSLETVPGSPSTTVSISATDGANRFTLREVRGVATGSSPMWMRDRLRKAGIRSISSAVDVTNYVMVELGHPLHAFDADAIDGHQLEVRWATTGESIETLDGKTRQLTPEDLVIVDGSGPTSLAAVMGGARSEVTDSTVNVLMEAAHWNPPTVLYTSRRHGLLSEASKRFERGVDPNLGPLANDRACELLRQIAGGEIAETMIDVVANPIAPWSVAVTLDQIARVLGDGYTSESAAALLERLQLTTAIDGDVLTVTVPTNRPDLTRWADLVEEIARLSDFDTFPETLPTGPGGGLSPEQWRQRKLRSTLNGLGLSQAINLPFVAEEELDAFAETSADNILTIRNPLRDDQSNLRQRLLPALLRNVRDNLSRGVIGVGLFETGRVFVDTPWAEDPRVPHQPLRLGVAIAGGFGSSSIDAPATAADGRTAFAVLDAIGRALDRTIERRPQALPGMHPGRSAEVLVDGDVIGVAGELHPDTAALFGIDQRVAVVEVDLTPLVAATDAVVMTGVSPFPQIDFDLSFSVSESVSAAALLAATTNTSPLVESAHVFDEYRQPDGARSLAVRYRLRAADRTLEGEDQDTIRNAMIDAAKTLGATLRGAGEET